MDPTLFAILFSAVTFAALGWIVGFNMSRDADYRDGHAAGVRGDPVDGPPLGEWDPTREGYGF